MLWSWLTEYVIPRGKINEQLTRVLFSLYQQKKVRMVVLGAECWLYNKKWFFLVQFPDLSKFFNQKLTEVAMVAEKRLCIDPKAWALFYKSSFSYCCNYIPLEFLLSTWWQVYSLNPSILDRLYIYSNRENTFWLWVCFSSLQGANQHHYPNRVFSLSAWGITH